MSSSESDAPSLTPQITGTRPAPALSPTRPVKVEISQRHDHATGHSTPVQSPAVPTAQVILPLYNEAGLIRKTFAEIERFAFANVEYGFVFVDDGSSDTTAATLQTLIAESDVPQQRLSLISYTPNRGKGCAVKVGIEACESPLVMFTDGDLAYSVDHLPRLFQALQSSDVVIGSRSLVARDERNTTAPRRIMGWTFNKCARLILGLKHKDTQAGLKGFRLPAAQAIFARQRLGGFAFDVELVYLAKSLGFRVAEIPAFVSEAHSYKRSKVNLFKDPAKMFLALVDVRFNALMGRYRQGR